MLTRASFPAPGHRDPQRSRESCCERKPCVPAQYLSIKACKFRREVEGAQVVGITWGPGDPFDPGLRWASLLKHMLERQKLIGRDFADDAVLCFDRLVLGRSQRLDW